MPTTGRDRWLLVRQKRSHRKAILWNAYEVEAGKCDMGRTPNDTFDPPNPLNKLFSMCPQVSLPHGPVIYSSFFHNICHKWYQQHTLNQSTCLWQDPGNENPNHCRRALSHVCPLGFQGQWLKRMIYEAFWTLQLLCFLENTGYLGIFEFKIELSVLVWI